MVLQILAQSPRDYNERLQLTRQRLNGSDFLRYVFTDPQSPNSADRVNDGRIIRRENLVSGETVTYQYDELQRLASAEATKIENQKQTVVWGLSWDYDGFGNRWEQRVTKGTAPGNTVSFDLSTNRINSAGYGADANGNMTAMPGVWGLGYDFDNRLVSASTNGYREEYAYLPDNRRVWKRRTDLNTYAEVEHYYLYGAHGERIGTYAPILADDGFVLTMVSADVYFGGRPIMQNSKTITLRDRLGSVMARGGAYDSERHDYFPYGEERTPTIGDRNKYGTYHRDQTGLDYADQRYYNSTIGRFLTTDPLLASASALQSDSWNRFSYVDNDPMNANDPRGLCKESYSPTSITVCGESVYVPYEVYTILPGQNGWNWSTTSQAYTGMQSQYESGGCTTWYGIPCYEEARQKGELLAVTQTVLDLAGLIPGYGELADLTNAMLYAAQGDIRNAGVSALGLLPVGGQAFTGARVFRKQLMDRLGLSVDDVIGKHAHHMLPQQAGLESFFSKAGINIHSPEWGTFWDAKDHLKNAFGYNLRWQEFFLRHPTAGVQQIRDFAAQMAKDYGLEWKP